MLFLSRFNVLTTRLPDPNQCFGTDVICAAEHSTLTAMRSCTHEQPMGRGSWQVSTSVAGGDGDVVLVDAAAATSTAQHTHFSSISTPASKLSTTNNNNTNHTIRYGDSAD